MTTTADDTAGDASARRPPLDPDATRRAATTGEGPGDEESLGHLALDLGTSSSAATFFVNIDRDTRRDRNQAAVLLGELATVLEAHRARFDDGFVDDLPPWPNLPEIPSVTELVRRLRAAAGVETAAADDPFAAEEDGGGAVRQRHRLLDATSVAVETYLEQLVTAESAEQDRILIDDILEAHRRSYQAVGLAQARLVIARLADDQNDINSALVLARDRHPRLGGQESSDGTVLRDLKTHLAVPRDLTSDERDKVGVLPESWARTSDLLLGSAYVDLVRRVHEYCSTGSTAVGGADPAGPRSVRRPELDGKRAYRLVVTYPCVTPPQARTRLAQLVADATGRPESVVDLAWDEAVAAAMFFVARTHGAETELGVEALCAASRWSPGDGGRRHWRRTLLVVDIGGGTTDIALVSLDLTEKVPDVSRLEPYRARSFDLRPRVLGTGGHDQLGGNLITLRVFYWLKALVVDALLREGALGEQTLATLWAHTGDDQAVPESLAEACTGPEYQDPTDQDPAPRAVRRIVSRILPTDAASAAGDDEHTDPHAAFLHVWTEADRLKLDWADPDRPSPGLAPTFLPQLGEKLLDRDPETKPVVEALRRLTVPLPVEQIEALVRPVYDEAMRLAGEIARERLGASGDPVLDTVALAGRSCGVEVARRSARDVIGRVLRDPARVNRSVVTWDTASVEVELRRAKEAASLGAAWVASRATMQTHASRADEQMGRTDLRIHAGDMFLQLPCSFSAAGPQRQDIGLLAAGTAFTRARAGVDGRYDLYVQSDWTPMPEVIELQRVVEPDGTRGWGRFDVLEHTGGAFSLGEDHYYCISMDQQLRPSLHLRVGDVTAWEVERASAVSVRLFQPWADHGEGRAAKVPRVEVENRDTGARIILFPGGTETWDQLLPTAGAETPATTGIVSAAYVTVDPEQLTRLRVHVDEHDGPYDVDLPGEPGVRLRWAAIDPNGTLLLLPREPLWACAATVAQLAEHRGQVYTTGFGPHRQKRNERREPFNGRH